MPHFKPASNTKQQPSVYAAECVCGRTFETTTLEFRCFSCGRVLVIEWEKTGQEILRKEEEYATHA